MAVPRQVKTIDDLPIFRTDPQPKQVLFLQATQRYVAYGGARGGGKSWSVRRKAVALCCKYGKTKTSKGINILIIRKTLQELKENHIFPLIETTAGIAEYKDKDKALYFCNGARIKFGYMDTEQDADQYQGQEYDVIFIDEATMLSEMMFIKLKACNRGSDPTIPKRMYLTCNPGGIGHAWMKRLFIDREYREGERSEDYYFIQAKSSDNAFLPEGYDTMLDSLPDGLREAWRDGSWDTFAGAFFTEYNPEIHEVEPFEIPKHWKRYMSIDYGLDMFAGVWAAIDEKGAIYVYRSVEQPNLVVTDACDYIRALEAADGCQYTRYAPPDLWGREAGTGKSQMDVFLENGMSFIKSDNDRKAGWLAIKENLAPRYGNHQIAPKIYFFKGCCKPVCTNLPLLQHNAKKPGDCMTEPHSLTHSPDALRYLCIMRKKHAQEQIHTITDNRFSPLPKKKKLNRGRKVSNVWKGLVS